MSNLPTLSESEIHDRASGQSLTRSKDYAPLNMIWRDNILTAEVEGSDYEPYQVEITFENGSLAKTYCTCPYDLSGDCKHIIATLNAYLYFPDQIEQRTSLGELLAPLNLEQMNGLLHRLVQLHPHLGDDIELLALNNSSDSVTAPSATELPALDTTLLRRQIKAELRGSIDTGYDSWGEEAWYDSDLSPALEPGIAQVQNRLAAGDTQGSITLLRAICDGWQEGIDSLDEYFVEYFDDFAEDFTADIGLLWAEAILRADIEQKTDATMRESWVEELEELTESMFGGESLEIAVTAAQQGWDYPPLQAAMAGNITEEGAWGDADEVPHFSDDLAKVRLNILEQQGDYQSYLNLAQAESQFMLYLHMLVKQDQSDLAMGEAQKYVTEPQEIQELSRTLSAKGEHEKAIELARHGLNLDKEIGKAELASWLTDLAHTRGMSDVALWAAQQTLTYQVSLASYLAVKKLSGAAWSESKAETLAQVAQSTLDNGKIEIYLHEGMHAEAIAVVDKMGYIHNVKPILEAVKSTHPQWAFDQCKRRADAIMDAKKSGEYRTAADWLQQGRDILLAAGLEKEWNAAISQILGVHHRKYKLVPMLTALR